MKNREKYAQKIIDILSDADKDGIAISIGVAKNTGEPEACVFMTCEECVLYEKCQKPGRFAEWLNAECKSDKAEKEAIVLHTILYLNGKTGKHFRPTNKAAKRAISARLNEGYTLEDFQKVIDIKVAEWTGTDYEKYLNPETLFGNKMDKYLNQPVQKPPEDKRSSKWGD